MKFDPHLLYWAVNLGSISVPFLLSFEGRVNFIRNLKSILLGILGTALLFIAWDSWFTQLGVWGFNEKYTLAFRLIHLPLEEICFFICIPYACLFSYEVIRYFWPSPGWNKFLSKLVTILGISLLGIGLVYIQRWYTFLAFSGAGVYLIGIRKQPFLMAFLKAYFITLLPFFIVNGILTGAITPEPVVWYNNEENLGVRLLTIPLEDLFYGMLMNGLVVLIYERTKSGNLKLF
ncbi:MAG: lycopene cyclase domain-containing protein [Bacteroidia bacterium]|nr:lycopene cyclase domain-containing protein [Bacteroidia bacterium]